MTALALVITQAGHARFTAAQVEDDIDLSISDVGLSDSEFVAAPTLTALPGEFRRLNTVSGEAVGDSVVHMVIRDDAPLGYRVRGIGLFLADGTLFATYGQQQAIFEKSPLTVMHLAVDIAFPTGNVELLTFGDTNFLQPPATSERAGVIALATADEVAAGTDARRAVTPLTLGQRLSELLAGIVASIAERVPLTRRINTDGLALGGGSLGTDLTLSVPAATADQLRFATAGNVAVTPATFGALQQVIGASGSYTLPGGLIIKWGGHRGRATSETTVPVTFDQPFPNACFRALATPYLNGPSTSDDYFCQRAGLASTNGFTVQYQSDDANGGLDGFDWVAFGN